MEKETIVFYKKYFPRILVDTVQERTLSLKLHIKKIRNQRESGYIDFLLLSKSKNPEIPDGPVYFYLCNQMRKNQRILYWRISSIRREKIDTVLNTTTQFKLFGINQSAKLNETIFLKSEITHDIPNNPKVKGQFKPKKLEDFIFEYGSEAHPDIFSKGSVSGNGNCFWYTISVCLFGTSDFGNIIKSITYYYYKNHIKKDDISDELNKEISTYLTIDEKWAFDELILLCAVALKRRIYVVSPYESLVCIPPEDLHIPLYIYNHKVHYEPLIRPNHEKIHFEKFTQRRIDHLYDTKRVWTFM